MARDKARALIRAALTHTDTELGTVTRVSNGAMRVRTPSGTKEVAGQGSVGQTALVSGSLGIGVSEAPSPETEASVFRKYRFSPSSSPFELITFASGSGSIAGDRAPSVLHPELVATDLPNPVAYGLTKLGKSYLVTATSGFDADTTFFNFQQNSSYLVRGKNSQNFTEPKGLRWYAGDRFSSPPNICSLQKIGATATQWAYSANCIDEIAQTGQQGAFTPTTESGSPYSVDGTNHWDGSPKFASIIMGSPFLVNPNPYSSNGVFSNGYDVSSRVYAGASITTNQITAAVAESYDGAMSPVLIADAFGSVLCNPFDYTPSASGTETYPGATRSKTTSGRLSFTQPQNFTWWANGVRHENQGTRTWVQTDDTARSISISGSSTFMTAACNRPGGNNTFVGIERTVLTLPQITAFSGTESYSIQVTDNANVEILPEVELAATGQYIETLTGQLISIPPPTFQGIGPPAFGNQPRSWHQGDWVTQCNLTINYSGTFLDQKVLYDDEANTALYTKITQSINTNGGGTIAQNYSFGVTNSPVGEPGIGYEWQFGIGVGVSFYERLPLVLDNTGNWLSIPRTKNITVTNNYNTTEAIAFHDGTTETTFGPPKLSLVGESSSALPTLAEGDTTTIAMPSNTRRFNRLLTQMVLSPWLFAARGDSSPTLISHQGTPIPSAIGEKIYFCTRDGNGYKCYECTINAIAITPQDPDEFTGYRDMRHVIRGWGIGTMWRVRDRIDSITVRIDQVLQPGAVPKIPPANGFSFFTLRHVSDLLELYDRKRTSIKATNDGWDVYFCGNHTLQLAPQYAAIAKLSLDGTFTWDGKAKKTSKYYPNSSVPDWIKA